MEYAPLSVHADWLPVTPLMLWSGADKTHMLHCVLELIGAVVLQQ